MLRFLSTSLFAFIFSLGSAFAQDQAALIADKITVLPTNELRASGNVEVLYLGFRLRATAITYSADKKTLEIEGPLSLTDAKGELIVLAETVPWIANCATGFCEVRNSYWTGICRSRERNFAASMDDIRNWTGPWPAPVRYAPVRRYPCGKFGRRALCMIKSTSKYSTIMHCLKSRGFRFFICPVCGCQMPQFRGPVGFFCRN